MTLLQAISWTLEVVGRSKFTSLTIKYSASAISIAAPSVNANIFMTPLWLSSVNCRSLTGGGTVLGSDFLTVAGGSS